MTIENHLVDALKYSVDLAGKEEKIIINKDGKEFYDSEKFTLRELEPIKYANHLEVSSLTAVLSYITANVDAITENKIVLHVESPTSVKLFTELNGDRKRELLLVAKPLLPTFDYGRWYDPEQFNISLQASFIQAEDRDLLIQFSSAIRIDNSADLIDDGVSQTTKIQNGVASLGTAKAPNPVTLKPYRTFLEVGQPDSQFIYRLNKEGKSALFEADGGKWRSEAIQNVAKFLNDNLSAVQEELDFIVLA